MINLDFVKPKNKLKVQKYNSELFNLIVAKIKEIEGYEKLRFDNELLKFVCTCIENGVKVKTDKDKTKIDKKKLVMEIYATVFTMTDSEKTVLGNSIDFLCDNKMIKQYSGIKKYGSLIGSYLKSKL